MSKRRSLIPLLCLFSACATAPTDGVAPADQAREAYELQTREDAAWRDFDAQLERLHAQRVRLREAYELPATPPDAGGELRTQAWEFCRAARRSQFAGMRSQEALNDLEHCRQALALAERQVETTRDAESLAREHMWAELAELRQEVQAGDREARLAALADFAAPLPSYYRNLLQSLAADF